MKQPLSTEQLVSFSFNSESKQASKKSKQSESDLISSQIKEFLAKGGEIESLDVVKRDEPEKKRTIEQVRNGFRADMLKHKKVRDEKLKFKKENRK